MNDQVLVGDIFDTTQIKAFSPFLQQLDDLELSNKSIVFDYEDSKGNKDARSHVFTLRKLKAEVDRARKETKDAALKYGKAVDGKAKEITDRIEQMIDVHAAPLQAIEDREVKRKATINARLDGLKKYAGLPTDGVKHTSVSAQQYLDDLISIDLSKVEFDDFYEEAVSLRAHAISIITSFVASLKKQEDDAAELEKLRQEKLAKEREERDAAIAAEAKENERKRLLILLESLNDLSMGLINGQPAKSTALKQALSKAYEQNWGEYDVSAKALLRACQVVIDQIEMKESEERQAMLAEQARIDAENEAKATAERLERERQIAEQAIKDEAERLARIEKDRLEAEQKRKTDNDHRLRLIGEAASALRRQGLSDETSDHLVSEIVAGNIPHITFNF